MASSSMASASSHFPTELVRLGIVFTDRFFKRALIESSELSIESEEDLEVAVALRLDFYQVTICIQKTKPLYVYRILSH